MNVWSASFWSPGFWSAGFWGDLVEFPQYVAARWPDWRYTEQIARATSGSAPALIAARKALRRGW